MLPSLIIFFLIFLVGLWQAAVFRNWLLFSILLCFTILDLAVLALCVVPGSWRGFWDAAAFAA
jgi:hypothetical protein